jgi:hypothetical protein
VSKRPNIEQDSEKHLSQPIGTALGFSIFLMFSLSIAALEILDRSNPIRWIAYAIPIFALVGSISVQNIRFSGPALVSALFLIVFTLSTVTNLDTVDVFYVGRDLVIYSLILIMLFIRTPITPTQIFLSMCCTFLLVFVFLIYQTQLTVSLVYNDSVVRGESTASIVYGALVIFFLINRRLIFASVSLLFALFTFKRTSYVYLFGACICWIGVEAVIATVGRRYRIVCIIVSTVALFLFCFALSFNLLEVLRFIQETFFSTVSLAEFTTGRNAIYLLAKQVYEHSRFASVFFGHGPGFIEKLTTTQLKIDLAHNEFLHHYIDYGLMGVIFFGVFILLLVNIRIKYYPIAFYLILVSLTDNPIYVFIICIPIICLFTMEIDTVQQSRTPLSRRWRRRYVPR